MVRRGSAVPIAIVLAVVLCLAAGCGGARRSEGSDELSARARKIVADMASGDFDTPVAGFDETMKTSLPATLLRQSWAALLEKAGDFVEVNSTRRETAAGHEIVYVTCRFADSPIDVKVVFDGKGLVAGLFFVPSTGATGTYEAPSYVDRSRFTEKEVTVGTGKWRLPGTLTLPDGKGPFPGVVLVHGSGPNDRDETLGPNKPFRDLAWGLASRGVAVLRYEKRTREYQDEPGAESGDMTVREETVDDALAAADLMMRQEGVDRKKVYVLGHSLGGMLIPRIAREDRDVHGFVIMAGPTRPLEDLLLEQMTYIFSLNGTPSVEQQAQLEQLEAAVAKVKDASLSTDTPSNVLPLGTPGAYWLDLRGYEPAKAFRKVDRPTLILQGERDYQVTMVDFEGWRDALAGNKNVMLESYPDLNHLFMTGEGKATPAEYERAGHVSEQVIDDIAGFVKSH